MSFKYDTESQLRYLLRRLTDPQRERLQAKLGWSESTWFRRLNAPGDITMDEAATIKAVIDRVFAADHDMAELRKPMPLPGKRA